MSRRLVDGKHPVPRKGADPGGKPSHLTNEVMKKIRNVILMGAPVVTAAALADISYDVMRAWVIKGKENPDSEYGALLKVISKAISEWEIRDLSAWDAHIMGRPAKYLQEPMLDENGKPIFGADGNPVMQVVKDKNGNPIIVQSEIKSDWRAAAERMARRKPRTWGHRLEIDVDAPVLSLDGGTPKEREAKEDLTFEQRVEKALKEIEEEI